MRQIAIDGPAAAGKTTMAKRLASKLGYLYVDTGALYRVIALYMRQKNLTTDNITEVLNTIQFDLINQPDGQHVYLFTTDVTDAIREPDVSKAASDVSAIPAVREFLLDKQRRFTETNNVVMEGRDIGSVILPNADIKFYLTADLLVRAQRRYHDELAKGYTDINPVTLADDLKKRDFNDSHRKVAPLRKMPEAILIDNTNLNTLEVEDIMMTILKRRGLA